MMMMMEDITTNELEGIYLDMGMELSTRKM